MNHLRTVSLPTSLSCHAANFSSEVPRPRAVAKAVVAFTPPHAALSELWLVCISTVPHRRMKWTHDRHGRVQNAIGETYRRRIIPMTNSKA